VLDQGRADAFVSRDGRVPLSAHTAPTITGNDLNAVADRLMD
jgi:hypothetical protein